MIEGHIERQFKWPSRPCRLGEKQSSLQGAHDGRREISGPRAWAESPSLLHRLETRRQLRLPSPKASGQELSGSFRPIRQCARQGSERAAADTTDHPVELDDLVAPLAQIFQGLDTG